MMKILFVEDALDGHHSPYLNALTSTNLYESVVITPEHNDKICVRQIVFSEVKFPTKSFRAYFKWIRFVIEESKKNQYDVVHFVDGDTIMRFFGIGFSLIRAPKVVITYHGFYRGILRTLSYRLMCHGRTAVVHTNVILENMSKLGIKKVNKVEYPSFSYIQKIDRESNHIPVLGALGATRRDKGLDILLKALEKVKKPYRLLIAGQESDITQKEIEEAKEKLSGQIWYDLRFLSDEEFNDYLNQTDIFVIPYRLGFTGTSGPLVEGAVRGKLIIGADHGSVGQVIRDNHIGKTFQSENIADLARVIEESLDTDFVYDSVAKAYQQQLTVEDFRLSYYKIYSKF